MCPDISIATEAHYIERWQWVSARDAKIVQAAGNLHDQIGNACSGQA